VIQDNELGSWHRRRNKALAGISKITNFVKAQRIKWFGYVMRRSDSEYLKTVKLHTDETKRLFKEAMDG
jgi:hypothetical protein